MRRAVQFDRYGDENELHIRELPDAPPGPGEVLVDVMVSGLNPGEASVREGRLEEMFHTEFPSGQGSDFAGTVAMVGPGVTDVKAGDEVIGMSDWRTAQAQTVTIAADHVVPKAAGIDWDQAGALPVAATTAHASVDAVGVHAGDTVVVSGAAGGVGILAAQLAKLRGATVYGTASVAHHDALATLGIEPVLYGEGLADRLPEHVDAFIDCHGGGNVEVAIELGVAPERINTIIDFEAVGRFGVKSQGQASVSNFREVIGNIAELIAAGDVVLPIRARFPFDEVREAYRSLANGHGLGKVVLLMGAVE